MKVETVFVSLNARNFDSLSAWWSRLLDRKWDRQPMPSCHEWDLAPSVLFQVLDSPDQSGAGTVTLRTTELDRTIACLREGGIEVPDPAPVEGFDDLRFTQFADPEGNTVGLLEGR